MTWRAEASKMFFPWRRRETKIQIILTMMRQSSDSFKGTYGFKKLTLAC